MHIYLFIVLSSQYWTSTTTTKMKLNTHIALFTFMEQLKYLSRVSRTSITIHNHISTIINTKTGILKLFTIFNVPNGLYSCLCFIIILVYKYKQYSYTSQGDQLLKFKMFVKKKHSNFACVYSLIFFERTF